MSKTFNLPDLGEGLTEADLVRWLVAEGDEVAVDQPIAEVETAKALVEVPCPFEGTVLTLHGAEGETMEVGLPLITVGEAGETAGGSDSGDDSGSGAEKAGALSYREEERAGVMEPGKGQPAPDKARGGDGDVDGSDEEASGNVLIGYGTPGGTAGVATMVPSFAGFPPKNHVDLCTALGLIDYERGVKMGGNGFWLYQGDGARLEWALVSANWGKERSQRAK